MSIVIESSGTGAGGMPPTLPAAIPRKQLEGEKDETPPAVPAVADQPQAQTTVAAQEIDEVTAVAVAETRLAYFAVWDAGKANRRKQGSLLLKAQAQLAKYGSGTFTAMLLAPRPDGFGFKSATSAYDLMAEAKGKPKRSHKCKGNGAHSTPGRSNEGAPSPVSVEGETAPANEEAPLPMNVEGEVAQSEECVVPEDLPVILDTTHTHVYVAFPFKGVYVPKSYIAGFTAWLKKIPHAALSCQFLAWYQTENPGGEEVRDETNPTIQ